MALIVLLLALTLLMAGIGVHGPRRPWLRNHDVVDYERALLITERADRTDRQARQSAPQAPKRSSI